MPIAALTPALLMAIRTNAWQDSELNLSERMRLKDVAALAEALKNNTHIKSLVLYHCNISAAGARVLATTTTLTSLDVSFNQIGDAGACALAANTILISLNVTANGISGAGA